MPPPPFRTTLLSPFIFLALPSATEHQLRLNSELVDSPYSN